MLDTVNRWTFYLRLVMDFWAFATDSPGLLAQGELIVWDSSPRPWSLHTLNMNISETSWPIVIKFHLEHHWGGGLAALVLG